MLSSAAAPSAAAAPRCGVNQRPWVSVVFAGGSLSSKFRADMLADFRARLAEESIEVCTPNEAGGTPPLAAIQIAERGATSVDVSVELRDAVTEKRVGRDIELARVPSDGRAVAVSMAAGELLRASWAEIVLAPPEAQTHDAPPEVERAVDRALTTTARAPTPARLGLASAFEHYAGGQTDLGADAFLRVALSQPLRLAIRAGMRESLSVPADHGSVSATTTAVATALELVLLRASSLDLALAVGPRLAWVRFRGSANEGAAAYGFSGVSLYARAGMQAELRLARAVWLGLGINAGLPLRALVAEDAGREVTAVSGLEGSATVGLGVGF